MIIVIVAVPSSRALFLLVSSLFGPLFIILVMSHTLSVYFRFRLSFFICHASLSSL